MDGDVRYDYSVAIPAYGRHEDLRATVAAALSQEFPGDMRWEVVINDDCTPTPLRDALMEYDGRARIERNARNLGFAGNWAQTLRVARGRWVHMLHSDDVVAPQFATVMWEAIRHAPPGTAFIHSAQRSQVVGQPLVGRLYAQLRGDRPSAEPPDAPHRVHRRGVEAIRHVLEQGVRNTTVVVRSDAARAIDGFSERYGNFSDEEYYVRLAQIGDVIFVPRPLVVYRYHGDQISARDWLRPEFIDEYGTMYDTILDTLKDQLTDRERTVVDQRVASVGVGVARAQALGGQLGSARATLRKARERFPGIAHTKDWRAAALLAESRVARAIYRSCFA